MVAIFCTRSNHEADLVGNRSIGWQRKVDLRFRKRRFPKSWGYPPKSFIFLSDFTNHPAIGDPPVMETPKSDGRQTCGVKIKQLAANLLIASGDVTLQSCWVLVAVSFFFVH